MRTALLVAAIGCLPPLGLALAQTWDTQGRGQYAQPVPPAGAPVWTGTTQPMSGGGSQTIWNSDRGGYRLCTSTDGRSFTCTE